MRLNKYLAQCGVCSRREADRLAEKGRILVNGQTAKVGMEVGLQDDVTVGHYTTVHEFRWDEIYTAAAPMENGVGWIALQEKYPRELDENGDGYVPYRAENQVLYHLCNAIGGEQGGTFEGTLSVIIRDSEGNPLTTYEETL